MFGHGKLLKRSDKVSFQGEKCGHFFHLQKKNIDQDTSDIFAKSYTATDWPFVTLSSSLLACIFQYIGHMRNNAHMFFYSPPTWIWPTESS